MTQNQKEQFKKLVMELSPEWLTCDGELSPARVAQKRAGLMAQWARLEAQVGRKVTEEEVWGWSKKPARKFTGFMNSAPKVQNPVPWFKRPVSEKEANYLRSLGRADLIS